MRIGKVSEKYHISVDNIYYYINYGLLVPPKPRGQYVFDEQTVRDLEWILGLKELDFSLREIHVILSLKRISGLADPQDMEELKEIFKGKRDFCQKEIGRKQQILEQLDSHIKSMEARESIPQHSTGVPLSALPLLRCPVCGGSLSLSEVEMDQRFIYKGNLSCTCGYSAHISSGILMTPNKNENLQDTPDITRELYKDLPPALISTFQRSYNWMLKQIEETGLHGKVIAETYIYAQPSGSSTHRQPVHSHRQISGNTSHVQASHRTPETGAGHPVSGRFQHPFSAEGKLHRCAS